jgi:3-dehydrotetronate 4-kinase
MSSAAASPRKARDMLLGCIADDFTGASDLANTLANNRAGGGMATVQFVGVPRAGDPADCDAGVVALKTRSIPVADAVAQSLAALDWLKRQGCSQFLFKYCSTFDSTPEGNIGPVAEALLDALDAPVAVVCPVFPATGRTLFMGHLFVGNRLLSESGMESHPLNPMTDADIRRWLALQCKGDVGLVPYATVRRGHGAIAAALEAEAAAGRRLAVVDAIVDEDLLAIGAAVAGHRLVTGGSGIALGIPENFRRTGELRAGTGSFEPIAGPGVALSGSCSPASLAQVKAHLANHPGLPVTADALLAGKLTVADAAGFVARHRGEDPIVYSSAEPEAVRQAQGRHGGKVVAEAIETFFGALARRLVEDGVTRIAVGGGETSGAVVSELGVDRFVIGPEIDPGVPALATMRPRPIRMALKSGNFGAPDFFAKALARLGRNE